MTPHNWYFPPWTVVLGSWSGCLCEGVFGKTLYGGMFIWGQRIWWSSLEKETTLKNKAKEESRPAPLLTPAGPTPGHRGTQLGENSRSGFMNAVGPPHQMLSLLSEAPLKSSPTLDKVSRLRK